MLKAETLIRNFSFSPAQSYYSIVSHGVCHKLSAIVTVNLATRMPKFLYLATYINATVSARD